MPYNCPTCQKRHANRAACPITRAAVRAQAAAAQQQAPPMQPVPQAASAGPGKAPTPPPAEKGSVVDRLFSWARSPGQTVTAAEAPTAAQSYLLDPEDVTSFWQIIFSVAELVINLFLGWIEAKPLPEELCNLRKSRANQLLVQRNMVHTTSQLFISIGVKTQAEAHAIIGEGEGIVAFGGIIVGIAQHLVTEVPKSRKWKEWFPDVPAGPKAQAGTTGWNWDPLGLFGKKEEKATSPPGPVAAGVPA